MESKYCKELEPGFTPVTICEEAARCLLCHDAPCSKSCPAGTDPGKFIRSVRFRNFKGAAETIRENNILGAICARVCPTEKYCQLACSRCGIDKPIDIGRIQRYVTDLEETLGMKILEKPAHRLGKSVAVVGGGDTACEEATYLAGLCSKVYMIVRRDVFRASKAMQERVLNTPNIEVLWNCNTQEILGDESGVTGARLLRKDGKVFDIAIDGFFLGIGHHPNSDLFKEWVSIDENGYIITQGKTSETNVEGVFAAGDVQDPLYRQAVTAAGSGCRAALDVEKFLNAHK